MIKNPYVILTLVIALGGLLFGAYAKGKKDCETAHALAQAKAASDSREEIVKLEKSYEKTLRQIRAQVGGGCVSPVIRDVIDGLPDGVR
jgi:hypothetical protein